MEYKLLLKAKKKFFFGTVSYTKNFAHICNFICVQK